MLDHHQTMGRPNLRGGTKGIHSSREAAGAKIKQGKGERGRRERTEGEGQGERPGKPANKHKPGNQTNQTKTGGKRDQGGWESLKGGKGQGEQASHRRMVSEVPACRQQPSRVKSFVILKVGPLIVFQCKFH